MHLQKMLDFDQFTLLAGEKQYHYDTKDGDARLHVECYSDEEVTVWLHTLGKDGSTMVAIPWYSGKQINVVTRVARLSAVSLHPKLGSKQTLSACVSHVLLSDGGQQDFTKMELVAPGPLKDHFEAAIEKMIVNRLRKMGIDVNEGDISLQKETDDDDFEDDGDDDEIGRRFAPVYADEDQPADDGNSGAAQSDDGVREDNSGSGGDVSTGGDKSGDAGADDKQPQA